ncbi:putative short chain dehydrogenase/ reductase [Lojkania enalia]|uniref:Short chain dehydrogenase/ reductase n=1 Tax=Lojkania enalia TaxID=147567 RepID=A0A9P4MWI9_9PLEO|nr:putative short chain dehydrogenase/ reductase [Didymosphaeria enalia]
MSGQNVFVVGGSAGLGKEMSKVLAAQGANVTIFSRDQTRLKEAKQEILATRKAETQAVVAVAADMSKAATAQHVLSSQPQLPDALFCVAGGTAYELGFLVDVEPEQLERCMNNNYYASLYPAQSILKAWIKDDKNSKETPSKPKLRKIIFVNSSASLVPTPGYIAYSAGKCAQRALADTLRTEVLRYNNPKSTYAVQCVFAHNFITPTFIEEQKHKPDLTKRLEGTTGDLAELEKSGKFPYAAKIAPEIVAAIDKGDFAIMDGRFEPQICWAVSIGSSPKRGLGIWDSCLALLACLVWPFVRWTNDREAEGDAYRQMGKEERK